MRNKPLADGDWTGSMTNEKSVDNDLVELRLLELARCRAVSALDRATLDRLLLADLSHTHVTGHTEDKSTYLDALATRPRRTEREDLHIRVLGDAAFMTGTLINTRTDADGDNIVVKVHALQVWLRGPQGWQMSAFAASGPLS